MFGEKVRKTQAQPFERTSEVKEQHRIAMHRLIGTEGFARIDTHCPMCPRDTCNGNCETAKGCDCSPATRQVQHGEAPSPAEPQPVVLSKPSISVRLKNGWRRLVDWFIGDEP